MREIKFRAWDTREKFMYDVYEIEWHWKDDKWEIMCLDGLQVFEDGSGKRHWDNQGDNTLMQYTGLKDKNGVEIYEGDVVADDYGNRDKVIWSQVDLGFELEKIITSAVGSAYTWVGLKIIGNIYENPKLSNAVDGEEK